MALLIRRKRSKRVGVGAVKKKKEAEVVRLVAKVATDGAVRTKPPDIFREMKSFCMAAVQMATLCLLH